MSLTEFRNHHYLAHRLKGHQRELVDMAQEDGIRASIWIHHQSAVFYAKKAAYFARLAFPELREE